tara:strand:- start:89 stop:553 length:465 start_codon:yes stop_codon:yes gene_type:complete
MELREQINEQYKKALKSNLKDQISTLRLIRSAIKDKDIELRSKNKNDDFTNDKEILALLQNLVKQRKESIDSFKSANRNDLIENEQNEINCIIQFLPKQLSPEEIKKEINDFIKKNQISSVKEMGKIMNHLKSNYAGKIDMGFAGKIAKEILNL